MDSAAQFKPAPPPAYSMDKQSQYYKEMLEVYEVSKKMTASQDTIATYPSFIQLRKETTS